AAEHLRRDILGEDAMLREIAKQVADPLVVEAVEPSTGRDRRPPRGWKCVFVGCRRACSHVPSADVDRPGSAVAPSFRRMREYTRSAGVAASLPEAAPEARE